MSQSRELIDRPPDEEKTRSPIVQEKREEKAVVGEDVDPAVEVLIPWRTSKRLQEATFKSLQGRDSGHKPNTLSVKKYKETSSPVSASARSLRRQHSPSETVLASEARIDAPPLNAGRKRRRRVHFGNPLFTHIDENKQYPAASNSSATAASSKLVSAKKSHSCHISRNVAHQQQQQKQQQKQSLSCFDLLCNHMGPRGWRCYRVCLEGQAFCSNHMNRATSLPGISVCT